MFSSRLAQLSLCENNVQPVNKIIWFRCQLLVFAQVDAWNLKVRDEKCETLDVR